MIKMRNVIAPVALIVTAPLTFACDYPAPPKNLPQGASAGKDEMLAGVKIISAYQEDMTGYLECIESDESAAEQALTGDEGNTTQQLKNMYNKKYNAAVDEQTRTVEQFNAEIRAYKARSK